MADSSAGSFQRVWNVTEAIPAGCVASYGQVAELAGLHGGARRVGRVLGQAPDRSRLPWHRIIRADGKIALPAGSRGRREQIRRLESEGVVVVKGRVDMTQFQWRPDMDELIWGPLAFPDATQESD